MTDSFGAWVRHRGGFFTRGEAKACGFSDTNIQAATRQGHWVRLRHGYYATADYVQEMTPVERHRLLSRAVLHRLGDAYTLVGVSACAAHGIELWGTDLSVVHVARLDRRSGRNEAGIRFHNIGIDANAHIMTASATTTVPPERAIWQAGTALTMEGVLVCLNSASHQGIIDLAGLHRVGEEYGDYPGTRHVRLMLRVADPRVESVGESRSIFLCWEFHLPNPEPQFEVRNTDGAVIARTDLAWLTHRYLAEFDGKVKYLRNLRAGESPSDVVVRESAARI